MSDLKLQQDELELLASYETEEWKSVKKISEQKEHYRAYACATFSKDKRVNIRIVVEGPGRFAKTRRCAKEFRIKP